MASSNFADNVQKPINDAENDPTILMSMLVQHQLSTEGHRKTIHVYHEHACFLLRQVLL